MDPTNDPAPQPSAKVAPSVTAVGASLQQAVATPSITVAPAGANTSGTAYRAFYNAAELMLMLQIVLLLQTLGSGCPLLFRCNEVWTVRV